METNESTRAFNGWRAGAITFTLIGLLLAGLSLIDVNPGFGVVQTLQMLLGLTSLTLGIFLWLYTLRASDVARSLQADIGIRLAATGVVFAYVSGFSDLIGIGTHVLPSFERPAVGWLQISGIILGVLSIIAGLILYHTSRGIRATSLLEFVIPEDEGAAAE